MALQYDLLRLGKSLDTLGSEALTWYDLRALVRHLQSSPDSALAEAIHGYRPWSLEAQLTAMLVDAVNTGNWQRGGKKTAPKPKPVERPWLKARGKKLGSEAIPVADFDAWWDSQTPAPKA